jgi:hypothetical protein
LQNYQFFLSRCEAAVFLAVFFVQRVAREQASCEFMYQGAGNVLEGGQVPANTTKTSFVTGITELGQILRSGTSQSKQTSVRELRLATPTTLTFAVTDLVQALWKIVTSTSPQRIMYGPETPKPDRLLAMQALDLLRILLEHDDPSHSVLRGLELTSATMCKNLEYHFAPGTFIDEKDKDSAEVLQSLGGTDYGFKFLYVWQSKFEAERQRPFPWTFSKDILTKMAARQQVKVQVKIKQLESAEANHLIETKSRLESEMKLNQDPEFNAMWKTFQTDLNQEKSTLLERLNQLERYATLLETANNELQQALTANTISMA